MQQEERNLRAALLEEKEKQERAEWAEQEAWQANMAALNAQVLAVLSATQRNSISLPQAGLGGVEVCKARLCCFPQIVGKRVLAGLG